MSEGNGSNGDGNRATVALVAEKLDGLKELTTAGFVNVQRQLDGLVNVPRELSELRERHQALERRVTQREREDEKHREWKRGPALALSVGVIVAGVNFLPVLLK